MSLLQLLGLVPGGGGGGAPGTLGNDVQVMVRNAVLLAVLGSLGTLLWRAYHFVSAYVKRMLHVQLTIKKGDPVHDWLLAWLDANRHAIVRASSLTVSLRQRRNSSRFYDSSDDEEEEEDDDDDADADDSADAKARRKNKRRRVQLLPGEGTHVMRYAGHYVWMTRTIGNPIALGSYNARLVHEETITLVMLSRSTAVLERLINDAHRVFTEGARDQTVIYTLGEYGGWRSSVKRQPRPLSSVVLDGEACGIVDDARRFLASEAFYRNTGIPWRRGYLLYGEPGCGKTSTLVALAGELRLDLCMLSLSSHSLTDEALVARINDMPRRAMLILEDVDALFVGREEAGGAAGKDKEGGRVSFSGLLQALDGASSSSSGTLTFLTTNHLEVLDPALIRPGRVDVRVKFELASRAQMERLYLRFFPDERTLARDFAAALPSRVLSPAQLQGHLLRHRDSARDAAALATDLLTERAAGASRADASTASLSVGDVLRRLALPQRYAAPLKSMRVASLGQLQQAEPSDVVELLGIKNVLHRARATAFFESKVDTLRDFALATAGVIKSIFARTYRHCYDGDSAALERDAASFAARVPDETFSSFEIAHFLSRFGDRPSAAIEHAADMLAELDTGDAAGGSGSGGAKSTATATTTTTTAAAMTPGAGGAAKVRSSRDLLKMSATLALGASIREWIAEHGFDVDEHWPKFDENAIYDMQTFVEMTVGEDGDEALLEELGFEKRGERFRLLRDLKERYRVFESSAY